MNYFVYFICLLCLTSLTMLASYDVSETLNSFIKKSPCCENHSVWLWLPVMCLSSLLVPFWAAGEEKGSAGHPGRGDLGISFWVHSTNPYKRLSGYKVETRGDGEERTANRLEPTIILSPFRSCQPQTEVGVMGRLVWIAECFCVASSGGPRGQACLVRRALDERFSHMLRSSESRKHCTCFPHQLCRKWMLKMQYAHEQ